MITFLDGPAKTVDGGTALPLRRAPVMLRVVISSRGVIDALDQVDDVAANGESIHVYRLASRVDRVHLCVRGKGRAASGWWPIASYRLFEPQPLDMQIRENADWAQWCDSVRDRVEWLLQSEGLELQIAGGGA